MQRREFLMAAGALCLAHGHVSAAPVRASARPKVVIVGAG
jgi:hypothetical protein